jgi:3-oxoacyl-[acyl-carrier-protein] synthase III
MNRTPFSGARSAVSVSMMGVGSYLPEQRVSNRTMLERIDPRHRDGTPFAPDWIEKHVGILERRLDFDFAARRKRERSEGGLYDGDLALRAARAALANARLDAGAVDVLVHITTTPDTIACADHLRFLTTELGLRHDVDLVHHNLGCAGLAAGLRTAAAFLRSWAPATALVVASNCPSGYFAKEAGGAYRSHASGFAWLSPLVFSDGAGAVVLRSAVLSDGDRRAGLLAVRYETSPDIPLVTYPAGGCLRHTSAENVADHLFIMDGRRVNEVFAPLMQRNLQMLKEDWPTDIAPIVGVGFDPARVARWYLHQANAVVVRRAGELLGLPADRIPINADKYGNTSAASTLILLDEDRAANRVREGDLVVFMWIGAGNGAMNGYAALIL